MAQPHNRGGYTSRIPIGHPAAFPVARGPNSNAASRENHNQAGVKRKNGGGRGREWARKCLKLLEAMLELEDSKPFRNPVDTFKYPNYYEIVREPMDLSKVMVKLHLGKYASIEQFGHDVQLIFENWKKYVQDPSSQIYVQIHRLGWWFDLEFTQILDVVQRGGVNNKKQRVTDTAPSSDQASDNHSQPIICHRPTRWIPPSATLSSNPEERTNSQTAGHQSREKNQDTRGHSGIEGRRREHFEDAMSNLRQQLNKLSNQRSASPNQNTNIVVSINNGTCTILQDANSSCNTPKQTTSTSGGSLHTQTDSAEVEPNTSSNLHKSSTNPSDARPTSTNMNTGKEQQARTKTTCKKAQLEMHMEATNIWFGPCRNKPVKPVILNEEGFMFYLRKEDGEVPFHIGVKDIIRCVGHLGPTRKHTLFVFISPSCEKRLKDLTREHQVFGQRPKGEPCSLIAVFIHGLLQPQISKLVHIFWIMNKHSMFGQLFSEVDQKGALTLLANIKPQILERVAEKQQESDKSGLEETSNEGEKHDHFTDSTPEKTHQRSTSGSQCSEKLNDAEPTVTPATGSVFVPNSTGSSPAGYIMTPGLPIQTVNLPQASAGVTCTPLNFSIPSPLRNSVSQLNSAQQSSMPSPLSIVVSQANTSQPSLEQNASSGQSASDILSENSLRTLPSLPESVGQTIPRQQNGSSDFTQELSSDNVNNQSVNLIEDDEDLEIVIPSEDDDDDESLAFTKKSGNGSLAEIGDDLVMTATRVSIKCPITQQTMKCPMKNRHCGHAYDRDGVLQLIANRTGKAKCPVPGCQNPTPLNMIDLQYDWTIRELIDSKAKRQ